MKETLDVAWIPICSALVFVMQVGFICLESGLVRSKNSINVAIKNTMDAGKWVLDRRVTARLMRIHDIGFPAEIAITDVRREPDAEYTLQVRDETKNRRIQDRLQYQARYDHLTGLPNRGYFQARLQYYLKRLAQSKGQAALMFIDLDRFKIVNDSLGHPAGDKLLNIVSARLREQIRSEDMPARWGGDEFIIALPGLGDTERIQIKAREILEAIRQPVSISGHDLLINGSIGIACFPESGSEAEDLIRSADRALFYAKQNGRNNFHFFNSEMEESAKSRFSYETDLRVALIENEFFLEFQPQVDVESGEIFGVEALVRWQHPERGRVPPVEFIPIMEETGMIVDLGKWVIDSVCRQNKLWQAAGLPPVRVAVNLSGRQFLQRDFASSVATVLDQSGLEAEYLELEITETVLADDTAHCIQVMQEIRSMGVKLSVDDFGTGYSSLSYLKRLPIDLLKIDRSFVDQCDTNPEDAAQCSAIIALARNLGLKTIAEGVEKQQQLDFLRIEGCEYYQGYYFSQPVGATMIASMLVDQSSAGAHEKQGA